jgi:hypothetical protein
MVPGECDFELESVKRFSAPLLPRAKRVVGRGRGWGVDAA